MNVVLVDEDPGMRAFVREMLAGRAMTVVEVGRLGDCPAVVAEAAPDLVLLAAADLHNERGWAIAVLLRRASPTARLLVLGAGTGRRAIGPDADGYLPYPFDAGQLLREVDRLIGRLPPSSPHPGCRIHGSSGMVRRWRQDKAAGVLWQRASRYQGDRSHDSHR